MTSDPIACEHGILKRQCRICELEAELVQLRADLSAWRSWAQFVWLGGGEPIESDDELRQRMCEEADRGLAAALELFVDKVNARAEADMLRGNPIAGAHCRALQAEIAEYRKAKDGAGEKRP